MADTTAAPAPVIPMLKVATVDQKPFVYREFGGPDGKTEIYKGFLKDVLDVIADRAGFNYEFHKVDGYGENRPGKWTGIIGELVNKNVDIGGAALTVTPDREMAVDFTKPIMTDSINLLVQKPSWFDLGLGYLVRPFSSDYWIMILVVLLLIGLVFTLIGKFSPYEWGNQAADKDPRGARNAFSLRNSYLFALSTLTWQGYREAPRSISGRIMAAFWWMFVLFSLIAYTANLTAYLLARPEQIPEMPFRSYEDLVKDNSIHVGGIQFSSTEKSLQSSRSQALVQLWAKMNNQKSWVDNYQAGVEKVEVSNGDFVMLMTASSAKYYARRSEKCDLMVYGEDLFPSSMAFAVQKGSLWKQKFNEALRTMVNDGVMQSLEDKYWVHGGHCNNIDGRKYVQTGGYLSSLPIYPITLKDMAVAILLLFLGFIAAVIFLAVEIVHYNVTKKGKKLHRPAIIKNPPKIWKPKSSKAAKPGPSAIEEGEEAGASADPDALESVPLDDTIADTTETAAGEGGEEAKPSEEEQKLEV